MKRKMIEAAICGLFVCATAMAQKATPAIPYDAALEAKVEAALARLTLEEKIGQMCELTIDVITDMTDRENFRLNEKAVDKVFDIYKVGSILNVPLGIAQTPDTWCRLIRRLNEKSMTASKGIPQVYGVDQIHGASYSWGATLFPQEIGQAASFNREIPRRISEIAAYESRACLIPWVYSPTMDLGRQPLWSRMWESYGEDAYLSAEMAAQAVRGYQGDNPNRIGGHNVAACLKHYMAYGVPVSGKDRTPSRVAEHELREKYFEPFRRAVRAGALSVMVSSGVNNGIPFHANKEMLTGWLKEQLNWDGMIVTDWADINNLYTRDHVAATKKDAVEMAVNAGIDMSMVPYETEFCDLLRELVGEGRVPMARIDDAVRRILRLKLRLGLPDKATWDFTPGQMKERFKDFGSDRFADEAVRMAEECMVLLKNKGGVLPLRQGTRILVCGPNSDNMRCMNGGWSYTWQGDRTDEVCAKIGKYHTFYEALQKRFGAGNVILDEGVRWSSGDWRKEDVIDIVSVRDAAKKADVVIVVAGENSYCETPGNIDDLTLGEGQRKLVEAVSEAGKPVVLILNEGRPRIISDIEPLADAVVQTFLPGNYGGDALARLLAGDANFSGRMPYTYPRRTGSLVTYDYKPCESTGQMDGNYNYDAVMDVQYPFGYGLSYTTFAYSGLRVDKGRFTVSDTLTFSVEVTNTGNMTGKETVMLFTGDMVASMTPDVRRLRSFEKIELRPGEKKRVEMRIPGSDLAFVGADNRWRLEKGKFRAEAGGQSVVFECSETHIWQSPNK